MIDRADPTLLAEAFDTAWIELRRFDRDAAAQEHALVLVAMNIACRVVRRDGGIGLDVAPSEVLRAEYELATYDEENRAPPEDFGAAQAQGFGGVAVYWATMLLIHAASGGLWSGRDWIEQGSAQSGLIVAGEWWRAFTALGLHADTGHLIGNLVLGGVFAMMLSERLGTGLAWLAILIAGAAGNALNAAIQPPTHAAIGASTAVFAALGLLAAMGWRGGAQRGARGLRKLLPIAGGLVLLAFLGVGDLRTDVLAHISGFVFGIALGLAIHPIEQALTSRKFVRLGAGPAALALFTLAWVVALAGF